MEFTVKAVGEKDQKSMQQVEDELLKKHEEDVAKKQELASQSDPVNSQIEIDDNKIIEFFDKKYGKKIESIDDLFKQKEEEPLPEDVSAFYNYKKETGRGLNDFIKVNRNLDNADQDSLLKEYYSEVESGLDEEDINTIISDKFSWDEDLDDEREIKRKKLEKKKELAKAKEYFESQKQKYKAPLESSYGSLSEEDKEALKAYKQYIANEGSGKEKQQKQVDWFLRKTEEVFNKEFKGFEFKIGDKQVRFSPGDHQELKNNQSDINNFISKFVGEDGLIKDAEGYHRSLAIAMNPDKFAKFFYEQGASDSSDSFTKKVKNIDFRERSTPLPTNPGSIRVQSVGSDSGRGLKIVSKK
jgi:hypothetical protein